MITQKEYNQLHEREFAEARKEYDCLSKRSKISVLDRILSWYHNHKAHSLRHLANDLNLASYDPYNGNYRISLRTESEEVQKKAKYHEVMARKYESGETK